MPLPANVTTVTVRGTFLTPEGDPSTGTVSFTPSSWLLNSGANIAIPNSAVVKTLGTAGDFSALLPITDDPDLSPGGWVYSVSEVVDGVSQSYNIAIPGTVAAGGTVFLADLAPVAPAGPEYYSLASSLSIGTVTTVATGGSATATITGLAPSQVLNLGIPTGATGTVASAGSGSVGTAAVAPQGDPDTGIYFPAANQVAITTGGSAAATFAAGAISNPTFTGVAQFPDGSASAPSITNTGDTNTGIFHPAEDTVAISTGGTERLRVTSAGRLGINRTSPSTLLHVRGDHVAGAGLLMVNANSGQRYTGISLHNDATLCGFLIHDNNTSKLQLEAGTGQTVSIIAGAAERLNVDGNGLITGTGTSLGAWTAYTPTLGGTGWAIGNGTTAGRYCQIGKTVLFTARVTFGSTSTFGAGQLTVSLPVASSSGAARYVAGIYYDDNLASRYPAIFEIDFGASSAGCFTSASPMASVTSSAPFTWASGDLVRISGSYEAA